VVDADDVDAVQQRLEPANPPGVVVGPHRVPVVQRVAPPLALALAVGVRRHPGDGGRFVGLV
jgi:hypothetical protein